MDVGFNQLSAFVTEVLKLLHSIFVKTAKNKFNISIT